MRKVSRVLLRSVFVLASLGSVACATSFTGDAHVPDGPRGCWEKCKSWDMELAGMVAMGEYSDGCICRVPARPGSAKAGDIDDGAVAASAAAVGVVTAMQARQAQAQVRY